MMNPETAMNDTFGNSTEKINVLTKNIGQIIRGKEYEVKLVLTCLFARGHILLEDNPGSGKTQLAKALAQSISGGLNEAPLEASGTVAFRRIQFTPDLLPMDLIGSHIFDESQKEFIFKKGPLFTNVLLADEINRASPKVQSALLECMAENQISVSDKTWHLDKFFFAIATQNPIEMEGTYPLPAAQLDRFFMKTSFGYVTEDVELLIYKEYQSISDVRGQIKQVLAYHDVIELQQQAEQVFVHEEILKAVVNIVQGSRKHPEISMGCSTRGGITFIKCLKAWAMVNGRNYVIDDDIRALVYPVLQHRLIFRNREAYRTALKSITDPELDRLNKLAINR
jgi:MoxR-like ATPase